MSIQLQINDFTIRTLLPLRPFYNSLNAITNNSFHNVSNFTHRPLYLFADNRCSSNSNNNNNNNNNNAAQRQDSIKRSWGGGGGEAAEEKRTTERDVG